jgi:hypothetical protein
MKNHLPNSNTDAGTLKEWELQIKDLDAAYCTELK